MRTNRKSLYSRVILSLIYFFGMLGIAASGGGGGDGGDDDSTPASSRWDSAELIETVDTGWAERPDIAADSAGNAIAIWELWTGAGHDIWVNLYTNGAGWGVAERISTSINDGVNPKIEFDNNGNAIAIWRQSDGVRYNIVASRYTMGVGWGAVRLIESDNNGSAYDPDIAFDSTGNAVAVWSQGDGTRANVWANRYTMGVGWGTAELIETNPDSADPPGIAIDATGNAIAVWTQFAGAGGDIWANLYTAGIGWGTAELIESNAGEARDPRIAMDAAGNGVAVWLQSDGLRYNLWANRYTAGIGWGTPESIESNPNSARHPQVAMDSSGKALAVWSQNFGSFSYIYANIYTVGAGWDTAVRVDGGDAFQFLPQIALDASGNALVVWEQFSQIFAPNEIWSNYYSDGSGWGAAERIDNKSSIATDPVVAMNASGNGFAVWIQDDETWDSVWANRFD